MLPQRVVVLADDEVLPFELSLAHRVLGGVVNRQGDRAYDVRLCSMNDQPIMTDGGFMVTPSCDLQSLKQASLVLLAPSPWHATLGPSSLSPAAVAALELIPTTARIASLCLASFVLASAGLLNGLRATTHWARATELSAAFPSVRVEADALYVQQGRILTSAGAAAGIDMLLHIIREDHGSGVANEAARRCVVSPWRNGGQQQYIPRPLPLYPEDSLSETLEWATSQLGKPLTLDHLAAHAMMSRRTFTRKFRETTGTSPGTWLLRQRLEYAKQLLETSSMTVEEVAHAAGFGSGSSFRKHLLACAGLSPSAYRQTFHE